MAVSWLNNPVKGKIHIRDKMTKSKKKIRSFFFVLVKIKSSAKGCVNTFFMFRNNAPFFEHYKVIIVWV